MLKNPYLVQLHRVLMLHIKQNSHFYTVALAYKTSLILQAQGVRRAWVGDYDTLPQFISINKQAVYMNIIMW